MSYRTRNRLASTVLCIAAAICFTSCEDDGYDHMPPEGHGSIIIDNESGSDAEVYLDGIFVGAAEDNEATVFDLEPGVYRLVLAEEDGSRNYRNDIDVLLNRLTILEVMNDWGDASLFHVIVDFEEP